MTSMIAIGPYLPAIDNFLMQEYNSEITHLNVAGSSKIVISSAEAANDLLEKQPAM
ncbi:hypothetical protein C8J57DRAFT_1522930 [Mycena rebaudengoi]|nr:hypothetical protein C8J57DRAFT_1522930 [Mycena rebaudengoi]